MNGACVYTATLALVIRPVHWQWAATDDCLRDRKKNYRDMATAGIRAHYHAVALHADPLA